MSAHVEGNPFRPALLTSSVVLVLIIGALLSFFVSPLLLLIPLAFGMLLYLVFHRPIGALGAVLAFMPFDFMAIALGKFVGLPHMTLISVCDKEGLLLLLAFILWRRNGFKPVAADWFIFASFGFAVLRTVLGGTLVGLVTDFNFIVPYLVGRMAVLTQEQEQLWASCAVWITAILSILGLAEVFFFGDGPRTILYLAIDSETEGGALTSSFHGVGFTGLREAATMIGPNGFGALCMVALIIWWVYCRNPLPAGMIGAGLICSVTRSAWLGAVVGISLLAVMMNQKKRLLFYATAALALFLISIPILGLTDYLFYTETGQDPSAEGHQQQIVNGFRYAAENPLGSGNQKIGVLASKEDSNSPAFETTYPDLAAKYGIAPLLCLVGFLVSASYLAWRKQSLLGYTAVGVLVGIALVMVVTLPLVDRRLVCWVFFPAGMALRSAEASQHRIEGYTNQLAGS